jgi:parallel beta-helix repeat protein
VTAGRQALLAALACLSCGGSSSSEQGPAANTGAVLSVQDYGARGDGRTFDTAALQAAADALPRGGTLRFPPGTYRIESDRGLKLKDDVHLDLGEAVLTGDNVDGARCRLIDVARRRNVTISGGTLVGSRSGSPQWGVGIFADDAENLVIENVTVRDFYFDGILLTGNTGTRNVTVRGVVAENNRRTGLAAPAARDVTVESSTFRGTRGQQPEAGINFEPNDGGEVRGVHVRSCTVTGNAGVGVYVQKGKGKAEDASVESSVVADNGLGIVVVGVQGVSVTGNTVSGHHGRNKSGIVVGDTSSATIADNRLEGNSRGILSGGATGVVIRDNTVVGTGPGPGVAADGIVCLGSSAVARDACTVTGNTVRRCAGSGIVAQLVAGVQVANNTVEDVGERGVLLHSTSDSEVSGNSVSGAGGESAGAFDAIELAASSSRNTIATNTIRLVPATRRAIGVCPACVGNRLAGNVVLPY